MRSTRDAFLRSPFGASLDRSFVQAATWPIDRPALAALIDMEMTHEQIATYFAVEPAEVSALVTQYRLGP